MKICVESGSKANWDNIINTVKEIPEFNASFIGHDKLRPMSLIFEITCDDTDYAITTIKKAIKSTDYGKAIMFRVVPHGQLVYFAK